MDNFGRMLSVVVLQASLLLAAANVAAKTPQVDDPDGKIEIMTDMLMKIRHSGVEFGVHAAADAKVLAALAPGKGTEQINCLRQELSFDAFRKRRLAQVNAYAGADRSRFDADFALLEGGVANTLQVLSNANGSARTEFLKNLNDQQQRLLISFYEDPKYRSLRELTQQTFMERAVRRSDQFRLQEAGWNQRSMALAFEPAFQACRLPLTPWIAEILTFTKALEDPSELAPDFGRTCNASTTSERDSNSDVVTPPRADPNRPIRPPTYPQVARRPGVESTVIIETLVNEQGEAVRANIKKSSDDVMLDSAAVQAPREWHFIPAAKNGKPVCMTVAFPLVFNPTR